MKNIVIRIVSIALLLGMLICCFSCGEKDDVKETINGVNTNQSGLELPFGKENYQKDFTILYYTAYYLRYFSLSCGSVPSASSSSSTKFT